MQWLKVVVVVVVAVVPQNVCVWLECSTGAEVAHTKSAGAPAAKRPRVDIGTVPA